MFSLTQTTSRQREILEIVFSNGWDYMRGLLSGGKASEPKLPSPEVLRNILLELGPVYVKLGQLLSTRPDVLPSRYIDALSDLQANVPPVGWGEVKRLIEIELGQPIDRVFHSVDPEAIAAGSIGQVHKAILADGTPVALKVQRPNIEQVVAKDISLIISLAELASLTDFGKDFDLVSLAEEFTNAITAELDYQIEGRYTEQLQSNLSQSKWFDPTNIVVPKVYWQYSTSKILIIEWLNGVPLLSSKIAQTASEENKQKRELTTLLFRAFFQQIYIDGFFHADPHPGNLFYLDDGRLAILDCGMMGKVDPRTQQILTQMLLAVVDIDAQRCAQLTIELAEAGQPVTLDRLTNNYDRMLRKYHNLSLSEINFSQVFYEVLEISRENGIKMPSNMGLYAKALANLEGVARTFDPQVNLLDEIKPLMTDLFRRQLLGDDPAQTLLRVALDLKSLSLSSPRQLDVLLDRITSESLKLNLNVRNLPILSNSLDQSANRLSFSIIVGALIMGAATITTGTATAELSIVSTVLFTAASLLGFWLIIGIIRSGQLK